MTNSRTHTTWGNRLVRILAGLIFGVPLVAVAGVIVGAIGGIVVGAIIAVVVGLLWIVLRLIAFAGWRYLVVGLGGGALASCIGMASDGNRGNINQDDLVAGVAGGIIGAIAGGINGYFAWVSIGTVYEWMNVPPDFLVTPIAVGVVLGGLAGAILFDVIGSIVRIASRSSSGSGTPFVVTGMILLLAGGGGVFWLGADWLHGWVAFGWPSPFLLSFDGWLQSGWRSIPAEYIADWIRGGWIDRKVGVASRLDEGWVRLTLGATVFGGAVGGVICGAVAPFGFAVSLFVRRED